MFFLAAYDRDRTQENTHLNYIRRRRRRQVKLIPPIISIWLAHGIFFTERACLRVCHSRARSLREIMLMLMKQHPLQPNGSPDQQSGGHRAQDATATAVRIQDPRITLVELLFGGRPDGDAATHGQMKQTKRTTDEPGTSRRVCVKL